MRLSRAVPPPPLEANFAVSLIEMKLGLEGGWAKLLAPGGMQLVHRGGGLWAARVLYPDCQTAEPALSRALEKGLKERARLEGGSAVAPAHWKVQCWPWIRWLGVEAGAERRGGRGDDSRREQNGNQRAGRCCELAAGGGGDGGGPSRTGLVLEPLLEIKAAPPRGATERPRGEDFRCALDLGNVPNSLHALLSGNTRAC